MDPNPQQYPDQAQAWQNGLGPQMDEARRNLVEINRQVVGFIRANPGTCLLGALALGFIVGRLASRR
jgi:hypothetical protein